MVCQEEVFSWFQELSGYKRLDVMCGLLNMCLPIELRFFGTCVEELGKKDFHYLRDAESRANNMTELNKLTNLNEDVTRSKLIISLALLESSNHVCSNVIFNILTEFAKVSKAPYSDVKIFDEMLLLFTMVLYHPAFTFEQKSAVESQLNDIRQALNQVPAKDKINEHSVKEKSVTEPKDLKYSPVYSQVYPSGTANLNGVYVKNVELKRYGKRNEKRIELKLQVVWVTGKITEIVKTYQDLFEFRQFVIKMCSVDPKLQSCEINIPQLPVIKPGNKFDDNLEELMNRTSEFFWSINKLLPQLMASETVVSFFQGQNVVPTQTYPTSSQSGIGAVRMPVQQVLNTTNQRPCKDENVPADTGRMKSITIYNSQLDHSGAANQAETNKPKMQNAVYRDVNSKQSTTNRYSSPLCIGPGCSTPVISPHSSPITSPFASPSQSVVNSRSASPWIQRSNETMCDSGSLKHILSHDKLKKYKHKLINFTIDELRALSDDDFTKEGLPLDAVAQLRKKLDNFRTHPMNGLNLRSGEESNNANGGFTVLTVSCPPPSPYVPTMSSHSTDLTPAVVHNLQFSHSINRVDSAVCSPPMQVVSHGLVMSPNNDVAPANGLPNCNSYTVIFPQLQQPTNHPLMQIPSHVVSTESSPSCSEYSSPPGSPSEENRNHYDSSCSDEIEKESGVQILFAEPKSGQGMLQFGVKDKLECLQLNKKIHNQKENLSLNLTGLTIGGIAPKQVPTSENTANSSSTTSISTTAPKTRMLINTVLSPNPTTQTPQNPKIPAQQQQQLVLVPTRNQENRIKTPTTTPNPISWDNAIASVRIVHQQASTYRTSPSATPLVTTASRLVSTVTTTTSRPLNKSIYSQHAEDPPKMSPLPLQAVTGSHDSIHAMPYPSTTITYPNLPSSPGVAVTAASTFLPPSNCPPPPLGVLPATSSGCMSNCGCSCNQNVAAGNLPYAANFLPTVPINSATIYQYPHYLHSHNTSSFMPPTAIPPPTFHFGGNHMTPPPHIPNGVNAELMYSSTQYSMLQQNGSHSSRVHAQKYLPSPSPANIAFHGSYVSSPPVVHKAKTVSCYNCGIVGHRGLECKEATMEEITKPGQFRLNYTPSRSTESGD